MPTRLFVDTVFVIALINQRDQYHEAASTAARRYERHPLLVTDAVLLEIVNALARGYRDEAGTVIDHFISSEEVEIIHLTPHLSDQAFALHRQRQDKEWSLTDCISVVVMRQSGIQQALSDDQHFAQAGFKVLT